MLMQNIAIANSLAELKEKKNPDILFSTGAQHQLANLFEKSELLWSLGYADRARGHYSKILEVDPVLSILSDNKRYEVTNRYFQYETKYDLPHLLVGNDPRLKQGPLTEQDIQNINNKVDFTQLEKQQLAVKDTDKNVIDTSSTEHINTIKETPVLKETKTVKNKKRKIKNSQIADDIQNNKLMVLVIIGLFLMMISISSVYWYYQKKENKELAHAKHEDYLQISIHKYEEILEFISLLEGRRKLAKMDPGFNDFACQANIKSLTDINNELYALISAAKKNNSSDKDIAKFVNDFYNKAKILYATAPEQRKIKI